MRKQLISGLVSAALVVTTLSAAPSAIADEGPVAPPSSHSATLQDSERTVDQGLATEGFQATDVTIDPTEIEITAEAADPSESFTFDLDIDPETARGLYTVSDVIDGRPVTTQYTVDIETSTQERSVFSLTDVATGETYTHDSAVPGESVAFVIPVAFAAVSLSTALYYLAIGAAIVIGGVLALEAVKAVDRIIQENNRRSSNNKRNYYTAVRSGSKVYISPNGLTKSQALNRGRAGSDVWSLSRKLAKGLAKDLNPSKTPIGPEKHGSGYLWHFHPGNRSPHMHSFYGKPA